MKTTTRNEKELRLYTKLCGKHRKLTAGRICELRKAYEAAVDMPGKGALSKALGTAFPELRQYIGNMQIAQGLTQRATSKAKHWFLLAYGGRSPCHTCGKKGFFSLGDRPRRSDLTFCTNRCATAYGRAVADAKYGGNYFQSQDFLRNRIKFLKQKYGDDVTGPLKVPGAQAKVRATSLARYGVENFASAQEVKDKRARTNLKRYGCTAFTATEECREAARQSALLHYGVDHVSKAPAVRARKRALMLNMSSEQKAERARKSKATNLERSGVDHPARDPSRNWLSGQATTKTVAWRGHAVRCQGCEDLVLSDLEPRKDVRGVAVDRRVVGSVRYRLGGKEHVYFPDIRLLMQDGSQRVVECKSTFWLGHNGVKVTSTSLFKRNIAKFKAAAKQMDAPLILALVVKARIFWIKDPHHKLASKIKQALKQSRAYVPT